MDKTHNIFISHYGKDDEHVQRLKQRLKDDGYNIRNSSIDSTKYQSKRPSDAVIERYLRKGINWAGTFICLIGEKTHTRHWVNYEIKQAHLKEKQIVGIYKHGCANSVQLPGLFKTYGGPLIGWNSLDKLADIMAGKIFPVEDAESSSREPLYNIVRVQC